jgi:GTPase
LSSKRKTKVGDGKGLDLARSVEEVTRAIVVHVETKSREGKSLSRDAAAKLEEAIGLTKAIDLVVAESLIVNIQARRPATLIGEGKVDEIKKLVEEAETEVVIVNAHLTPVQQRNLERAWGAKVLDRTGLILEIFGRRASTKEGVLQVELAHLQFQKSRLVRSWTHLERQRGGFGFLGGPGESQLEADRRLIEERIAKIERDLENTVRTRKLHRKGRSRIPYPIVALVGYTNAGKSTLFNSITKSKVLAKDMLFATLDPTMRVAPLPKGRKVMFSDTVGFISDLPTTLVAAFRATLEEVIEADVILHVRDISHAESDAQAEDVDQVLRQLGIDDARRANMIEVWNKSDALDPLARAQRETSVTRKQNCVLLSALQGEGIPALLKRIETMLAKSSVSYKISLDPADGRGAAWLYEHGEVLAKSMSKSGKLMIQVRLDEDRAGQAKAKFEKAMRKG